MGDLVFHFWAFLAGLSILVAPVVPVFIVGASWAVWRAANRVSKAYRDTE